ncbi:histone deacetylase family protein [bacterium]|nr:histone deacetylase family protein [bacterium]NBX81577.1 histone deacetylase family protein [bacterium]
MRTQLYANPSGLSHETTSEHPERPERLQVLFELFSEPPFSQLPLVEAAAAPEEWLHFAHTQNYIDSIKTLIPETGLVNLNNEVVLSPGTWDAAMGAVGTVCKAVSDVLTHQVDRAFCAVRPPGHHALSDQAMGFCIFSNVFIGARYAQQKGKLSKIAIVDFDVHHGNGSEALARTSNDILVISSHQFPLWPGTGLPEESFPGKTLNIPLPPGSNGTTMRASYESLVFPALDAFAPELIMISAGFDAHTKDPLANLNWMEADYTWLTEKICAISEKHCGGKLISVLEGGYALDALKSSVAAHLKALADL